MSWTPLTNRAAIVPIGIYQGSEKVGEFIINEQKAPIKNIIRSNLGFQLLGKVPLVIERPTSIYLSTQGLAGRLSGTGTSALYTDLAR